MPVIYADVVWLVNFAMDAALLASCAWIVKRKTSARRIVFGAFIGSMYAMLLFLPSLSALTTWPGKAVVSLLMVGLGVPSRSWMDLARNAVLFYFVTFVFAGAAIALHYAVPGVSVASGTLISGQHLAYWTTGKSLALLVAIPLGISVVRFSTHRMKVVKNLTDSLYNIELTFEGACVTLIGLADTGNQLRHPLTGRPVCLVELSVLESLLPAGIAAALVQGTPVYDVLSQLSPDIAARFTVVPFRAAGGAENWTLAFRPDALIVMEQGKRIEAPACLIGVHVTPLSTDHRFQAILHIDVITGDERLETTRPADKQRQTSDTAAAVVDENPPETLWRQ